MSAATRRAGLLLVPGVTGVDVGKVDSGSAMADVARCAVVEVDEVAGAEAPDFVFACFAVDPILGVAALDDVCPRTAVHEQRQRERIRTGAGLALCADDVIAALAIDRRAASMGYAAGMPGAKSAPCTRSTSAMKPV